MLHALILIIFWHIFDHFLTHIEWYLSQSHLWIKERTKQWLFLDIMASLQLILQLILIFGQPLHVYLKIFIEYQICYSYNGSNMLFKFQLFSLRNKEFVNFWAELTTVHRCTKLVVGKGFINDYKYLSHFQLSCQLMKNLNGSFSLILAVM